LTTTFLLLKSKITPFIDFSSMLYSNMNFSDKESHSISNILALDEVKPFHKKYESKRRDSKLSLDEIPTKGIYRG